MVAICLISCSSDDNVTTQVIELAIKDNKFVPKIIQADSGHRIKLIISNKDKTTKEFESEGLKREKIIPAGRKVTIVLPALSPGEYMFYDDFEVGKPEGKLIVR